MIGLPPRARTLQFVHLLLRARQFLTLQFLTLQFLALQFR